MKKKWKTPMIILITNNSSVKSGVGTNPRYEQLVDNVGAHLQGLKTVCPTGTGTKYIKGLRFFPTPISASVNGGRETKSTNFTQLVGVNFKSGVCS